MKWIVSLRDSLKRLYADYDMVLKPLTRFLTAFLFLALLRSYIGFNEQACRPLIVLAASGICAVFPLGFITLVCFLFVLANTYSVSLALLLIEAILLLLAVFLYFGFRPGKAFYIILIPIGFLLRIPYAIPVILALTGGLSACIPVSIGVLSWFIIDYLHKNGSVLAYTYDISKLVEDFSSIAGAVFKNKSLFILLAAFVLCIAAVSLISRLSFNHSWTVSVLTGLFFIGALTVAGGSYTGTLDITAELVRILFSLPVVLGFEFLFFSVDYRATEHLQFEDDDYFYYVKAVPKLHFDDSDERKE